MEWDDGFLKSNNKISQLSCNQLHSEAVGIFTVDPGVTEVQLQKAKAIFTALPASVQHALLDGRANMELSPGWTYGRPEGENTGSAGQVYTDSGMMDQSLVHELYEMAGQISPTTLKGTWNDSDAVAIADDATSKILKGEKANPGGLADTIAAAHLANGFEDKNRVPGDGDLMSHIFVADFFASNPALYGDSRGNDVLKISVNDSPELADYIARAQGLLSAADPRSPYSLSTLLISVNTSNLRKLIAHDSASIAQNAVPESQR
jgi:hypothetical protein